MAAKYVVLFSEDLQTDNSSIASLPFETRSAKFETDF